MEVFAGALIKSAFLGLSAFVLITAGLIPAIFLIPMSLIQFATEIIGGLLAGGLLYFKKA